MWTSRLLPHLPRQPRLVLGGKRCRSLHTCAELPGAPSDLRCVLHRHSIRGSQGQNAGQDGELRLRSPTQPPVHARCTHNAQQSTMERMPRALRLLSGRPPLAAAAAAAARDCSPLPLCCRLAGIIRDGSCTSMCAPLQSSDARAKESLAGRPCCARQRSCRPAQQPLPCSPCSQQPP